jgi:hypothetical protein
MTFTGAERATATRLPAASNTATSTRAEAVAAPVLASVTSAGMIHLPSPPLTGLACTPSVAMWTGLRLTSQAWR